MEGIAFILFLAAMAAPVIALVGSIPIYLNYCVDVKGKRRSVVVFAFSALLVGVVGGWVGAAVGIAIFCSIYGGAQCGFGGVFFTGPLSFGLAVGGYLYFWAKRGKAS